MKRESLTLTVLEIKDLAEFAGLVLDDARMPMESDDMDMQITISDCSDKPVFGDDGELGYFEKVAYCTDYPEEGLCPLGKKINK